MQSRIMYIAAKSGDGLAGRGRIGRVAFSKTRKTLTYKGRSYQTLKGRGFKANYFAVETGDYYWISGPKRSGADRLHGASVPTDIDEDVQEEY